MVDKKKKWQEIQGFCKEYIKLHGYPPTVREIADGVDLRSTGSVNGYMIEMYNNGMLITEPGNYGIPRAFRVPGMHISFDEDEIPVVTEKTEKTVTFKCRNCGRERCIPSYWKPKYCEVCGSKFNWKGDTD